MIFSQVFVLYLNTQCFRFPQIHLSEHNGLYLHIFHSKHSHVIIIKIISSSCTINYFCRSSQSYMTTTCHIIWHMIQFRKIIRLNNYKLLLFMSKFIFFCILSLLKCTIKTYRKDVTSQQLPI